MEDRNLDAQKALTRLRSSQPFTSEQAVRDCLMVFGVAGIPAPGSDGRWSAASVRHYAEHAPRTRVAPTCSTR
jgi:hypothetical protein